MSKSLVSVLMPRKTRMFPGKISNTAPTGSGKAYEVFWRIAAKQRLGDKCEACGVTDSRILTFNHINGGGGKEKKRNGGAGYHMYRQVAQGLRDDINLLCFNCNWLYEYKRGRL